MPAYVSWITKLSFMTYGFTVLMINEFEDIAIIFDVNGYSVKKVPGTVILAQVGMDPEYFSLYLGLLACLLVIFLCSAFVLLRYFVKEKR